MSKTFAYILLFLLVLPIALAEESASLHGIVKDTSENLISNANLQFYCDFTHEFPSTASQFGTFSIDNLPAGKCRIFARYKDSVGMKDVTLTPGDDLDIEIILDKKILTQSESYIFVFLAIAIGGGAAGLLIWYVRKRKPHPEKNTKETHSTKVHRLGQRGKDIYNTLNAREKQIVDFLLTQKDHTVQSKIHHTLGIAKSSLFRTINSLESKNVVTATKTTKARRLKLSDWFLEK